MKTAPIESALSAPRDAAVPRYDVIVVGGGPAGATAADDLARAGRSVLLLDRAGRPKPCGGAIPPRAIRDFAIPDALLVAKIRAARMISPSGKTVDMPVGGETDAFVGMVDRDAFDEWLRARAERSGATRATGTFLRLERDGDGPTVVWRDARGGEARACAAVVIGADGAKSKVARQEIRGSDRTPTVMAYHEILRTPARADFDGRRCDVIYDGRISPDFYGWVFPHGDTVSVGMGTAAKDVDLRAATARLRVASGLAQAETIREEGAPIPLKPLRRWDNGRDVVLAGDAAGVVAPASGEGIYYALLGGRLAADAALARLGSGDVRALATARKRFMREHGRVFWALGLLQWFWYGSDRRREQFVSLCRDPDVQRLTWESYLHKKLVRRRPGAHLRVFVKDMAHLLGLARS